jgi:TatA/E family protein of Tat protein translocase
MHPRHTFHPSPLPVGPWHLHRIRGNVSIMFGMGPSELIVVLVIALLVLGPQRLPELARSLGKAIGEFKRATGDIQNELDNARVMLEEETRNAAREQQQKKGRGFVDETKSPNVQAAPAETTVARETSAGSSQPEAGAEKASANVEEAAKNA